VNYGIDFSFMIRDMDIGYRISGIFYGAWNFTTMIQALIIGVFMTVGVAYFPIRRGLKLEITEALRDK
jgi:ABC-type antimicrobial peptide transport system permease subunit